MLSQPDTRLALAAYETILGLIQRGEAAPGDMINERRMAERLAMSRTPVRDALLMLEGEGILVRKGARGLQVKEMRIEDFMHVLQIRAFLEPPVARLAAGRMDAAVIEAIRSQLNDILARDQGGGPADRAQVRDADEALHSGLAQASGNPRMAALITNLRRQTQMFDLRAVPERLSATCQEHLAILAAVAEGNGPAAATAMEQHLRAVRESIIQRLTGA